RRTARRRSAGRTAQALITLPWPIKAPRPWTFLEQRQETKNMQRKNFIRWTMGAISLAIAGIASAQAYPTKSVKVVIPFPPGGTLDTVGRQLAQKLSEQTGQSFIIENRPGGNGVIGGD